MLEFLYIWEAIGGLTLVDLAVTYVSGNFVFNEGNALEIFFSSTGAFVLLKVI